MTNNTSLLRLMNMGRRDDEPAYAPAATKPIDLGRSYQIQPDTEPANDEAAASDPALCEPAVALPSMDYTSALAYVAKIIADDPGSFFLDQLVTAIGKDRLIAATKPKPNFGAFPLDLGTLELSIWDNQPFEKDKGGNVARFAMSIKASSKTNRSPLDKPDWKATAELRAVKDFATKLRQRWKLVGPERDFIDSVLENLPETAMIGRMFLPVSAAQGGGTHWFPSHLVVIDGEAMMARDLSNAIIMIGDYCVEAPAFSKQSAGDESFPIKEKTTAKGAVRKSVVILQSRSSSLRNLAKWATGEAIVK